MTFYSLSAVEVGEVVPLKTGTKGSILFLGTDAFHLVAFTRINDPIGQ